jgi:hypothetical protein
MEALRDVERIRELARRRTRVGCAYGPVRQRYLCKLKCPALGYPVNWVPDAIMSLQLPYESIHKVRNSAAWR